MTLFKTMPAKGGGYFGLFWSEEKRRYVKVGPVNGYSFDSAGDALRAAKHRIANPFTMTAACPVPAPEPDYDALGVNKWRRARAENHVKAQLETFGTVRIKGRNVTVERRGKRRSNDA